MPINVSCPSCNTTLRAQDTAAGRKVKCPKCGTPFDVPNVAPVQATAPAPVSRQAPPPEEDYEDYEDEAPRRRRSEGAQSDTTAQLGLGIAALSVGAVGLVFSFIPCLGWIIAVPAGTIGLILGVVGLIVGLSRDKQGLAFPIAGASVSFVAIVVALAWWLLVVRAANTTVQQAQQFQADFVKAAKEMQDQAKQNFKNPGFPPVGAGGAVILNVNEQLTVTDPFDRVRLQSRAKTYMVNLTAGKTYQIDMTSNVIDPYLRLENPGGQEVAHDDDSGGFPNARIIYSCPQTGAYRIIATTFAAGGTGAPTGPFTLKVQER
jgi:predicted Zn finger-like uncharacterized protein